MPPNNVFAAGSLAKAYVDIAAWYGYHTVDVGAKDILVPFTGFGRMASAMCGPEIKITTCDFQRLSAAITRGVLMTQIRATNVDKPRFHKGHAVAGKLMRTGAQPDEYSAGFIDWVAENGTPLDVACIGMSIPSQTMRGWMSDWTGNFDTLYKKFLKVRDDCYAYTQEPGTWSHYEADFFDLELTQHFDAIAIDPPRLTPTRDMYSRGSWVKLNTVLGGTVRINPWTDKNYIKLLSRVMSINTDYILLTWTKGNPSTETIKDLALTFGTLEDEVKWELFSKELYGWRIKTRPDPWGNPNYAGVMRDIRTIGERARKSYGERIGIAPTVYGEVQQEKAP